MSRRNAIAVFIEQELHCTGHRKREPTLPPGTCHWEFFENDPNSVDASLNFVCPCGCGEVDFVFVATHRASGQGTRCWGWDGNREKPTLTPSIYRLGAPCKWHGHLRNGVFEES